MIGGGEKEWKQSSVCEAIPNPTTMHRVRIQN